MNAAPHLDSIICWRGIEVPRYKRKEWFVYLLHFDQAYRHAQHYLGSTGCLEVRLIRHRSGNGARLIEVITEHGLTFRLARLWHCSTEAEARALEKRLKSWHGSKPLCPLCNPRLSVDDDTFMRQGHQLLKWRDQQARPRRPMPIATNHPMK